MILDSKSIKITRALRWIQRITFAAETNTADTHTHTHIHRT